ncbi:MAG: DUF4907 domain-containing protein [Bacteroidales bacterium]|nr:DUF4907 domain-containing protein [Bacteroidales bacterium]
MTKTLFLFINALIISNLLILSTSCNSTNEQSENSLETLNNELPKRNVELNYFKTENGWGYNVVINGKNYIHQVHLPCECGGEGFATKEKAMKAAEFLKQKIENYDRSLYISRAQLDSLGAL